MDIVERLRERAHETQSPPTMELRQAADEIELLRKERDGLRGALQKIADWPDYRSPSHQEIARAALEEKK